MVIQLPTRTCFILSSDINECVELDENGKALHDCAGQVNSQCVDEHPGFQCQCDEGFEDVIDGICKGKHT